MDVRQIKVVSYSPVATWRDVWVFAAIVLVFPVGAVIAMLCVDGHVERGLYAAVTIGGVVGMVPSLSMAVTVRGYVARADYGPFIATLDRLKFRRVCSDASGDVYVQDVPRILQWDSNRVVVREREAAEFEVVCARWVMKRLRKA